MTIEESDIRVEGGPDRGRYIYAFEDGSAAEMNYVAHEPGVVAITYTYTPPRHRGHGVAAVIVSRAVQDFRQAERRVIPLCWFARKQFEEHPDWADLLHRDLE